MRRMSAASAAVLVCLAIGGLPALAQWGDATVITGTITDCVVTAPGTTTLVGVTSDGHGRSATGSRPAHSWRAWMLAGPRVDPRLAGTGTNRLNLDITWPGGMWDPEQVSSTVRWGTWEIVGPDGAGSARGSSSEGDRTRSSRKAPGRTLA